MTFKETLTTVQAIVTIGAVITGGIWSYNLFIKERKNYPHVNVEQKVFHVVFSSGVNILRIAIDLTNTGNCGVQLRDYFIRIQQVLPDVLDMGKVVNDAAKERTSNQDSFPWPLLNERKSTLTVDIEPGEKQTMDFEFAVPSNAKVVRVYSYFRNERTKKEDSEVGWGLSTYYDFRPLEVRPWETMPKQEPPKERPPEVPKEKTAKP
jgi:hypothetical protein